MTIDGYAVDLHIHASIKNNRKTNIAWWTLQIRDVAISELVKLLTGRNGNTYELIYLNEVEDTRDDIAVNRYTHVIVWRVVRRIKKKKEKRKEKSKERKK